MRELFAGAVAAAVTLLSGTATASASGEVGVTGVGNQVSLWNWNDYDSQPDHWVRTAIVVPWDWKSLTTGGDDKTDAITVHC